jgi:hypothetical protein
MSCTGFNVTEEDVACDREVNKRYEKKNEDIALEYCFRTSLLLDHHRRSRGNGAAMSDAILRTVAIREAGIVPTMQKLVVVIARQCR